MPCFFITVKVLCFGTQHSKKQRKRGEIKDFHIFFSSLINTGLDLKSSISGQRSAFLVQVPCLERSVSGGWAESESSFKSFLKHTLMIFYFF